MKKFLTLLFLFATYLMMGQSDTFKNAVYFKNVPNNNSSPKVLVLGTDGRLQYRDASTVGGASEWGSIGGTLEDQYDLVQYIADQIASSSPPVPTLQQVFTASETSSDYVSTETEKTFSFWAHNASETHGTILSLSKFGEAEFTSTQSMYVRTSGPTLDVTNTSVGGSSTYGGSGQVTVRSNDGELLLDGSSMSIVTDANVPTVNGDNMVTSITVNGETVTADNNGNIEIEAGGDKTLQEVYNYSIQQQSGSVTMDYPFNQDNYNPAAETALFAQRFQDVPNQLNMGMIYYADDKGGTFWWGGNGGNNTGIRLDNTGGVFSNIYGDASWKFDNLDKLTIEGTLKPTTIVDPDLTFSFTNDTGDSNLDGRSIIHGFDDPETESYGAFGLQFEMDIDGVVSTIYASKYTTTGGEPVYHMTQQTGTVGTVVNYQGYRMEGVDVRADLKTTAMGDKKVLTIDTAGNITASELTGSGGGTPTMQQTAEEGSSVVVSTDIQFNRNEAGSTSLTIMDVDDSGQSVYNGEGYQADQFNSVTSTSARSNIKAINTSTQKTAEIVALVDEYDNNKVDITAEFLEVKGTLQTDYRSYFSDGSTANMYFVLTDPAEFPGYEDKWFFSPNPDFFPYQLQGSSIMVRLFVDEVEGDYEFVRDLTYEDETGAPPTWVRDELTGYSDLYIDGATLSLVTKTNVKLNEPFNQYATTDNERILYVNNDGEVESGPFPASPLDDVLGAGATATGKNILLNDFTNEGFAQLQPDIVKVGYQSSDNTVYVSTQMDMNGVTFYGNYPSTENDWYVALQPNTTQGNTTPVQVKLPALSGTLPTKSEVVSKFVHKTFVTTATTLANSGSDMFDIIEPASNIHDDIYSKTNTIIYNGTADATWSVFTPGTAEVRMTIFNNTGYTITLNRTGTTLFVEEGSTWTSVTVGPLESVTLIGQQSGNRWYMEGQLPTAQKTFTKNSTVEVPTAVSFRSDLSVKLEQASSGNNLVVDDENAKFNGFSLIRVKTDDTLTTAKTADELNTAYPDAKEGDVIAAPTGTSSMYIKTKNAGQWQLFTGSTLNPTP